MYKLWNKRFSKKCDFVTDRLTDLLTDKVIHKGAPLLKKQKKTIISFKFTLHLSALKPYQKEFDAQHCTVRLFV